MRTSPLFVALAICQLAALRSDAADLESAIERSRRVARTLLDVSEIPGLSVSVAIDGRIVWSEGFGWADIEQRVPASSMTRFRTGSIAKPLSTAVVARLLDAGTLDIDSPLQRYLPDVADHYAGVTMRQLGGHLAGVRHYVRGDPPDAFYSTRFDSSRAALIRFAASQPVHQPGKQYHYSTYGYTLLAAAVEGAAQRDFGVLLEREVTRPLGLRSTVVSDAQRITPDQAAFYERSGGEVRNAPTAEISYKVAGGGLLSTSDDLVMFASALMQPGFLKQETLEILHTEMKTDAGEGTGYGFGWNVGRDAAGRRTFGHGGGQIGCSTRLIAWPEQRLAIAIMCNIADAPVGGALLSDVFLDSIAGKPPREADSSLEGVYEVSAKVETRSYAGWLALVRDGSDYRGEMVLTNAENAADVRRARVATAFVNPDGATEVILLPRGSGMVRIVLRSDGQASLVVSGRASEASVTRK